MVTKSMNMRNVPAIRTNRMLQHHDWTAIEQCFF